MTVFSLGVSVKTYLETNHFHSDHQITECLNCLKSVLIPGLYYVLYKHEQGIPINYAHAAQYCIFHLKMMFSLVQQTYFMSSQGFLLVKENVLTI